MEYSKRIKLNQLTFEFVSTTLLYVFDAYADQGGGSYPITLRTGVSFSEALRLAERQISYVDRVYHDEYEATGSADYNQAQMLIQLAHGTWDRTLISVELADTIQEALAQRPLHLTRNPWATGAAPTILAASEGVRKRLWSRVSSDLATTIDSPEGPRLSESLFAEVFQEAILDWAGVGGQPPTRKCAMDGHWYTPKMPQRARFCSDDCRRRFNNIRTVANEAVRSFQCTACMKRRDIDRFAGLRLAASEQRPQMTQWTKGAEDLLCVRCVRSKFPPWSSYVEGISAAER